MIRYSFSPLLFKMLTIRKPRALGRCDLPFDGLRTAFFRKHDIDFKTTWTVICKVMVLSHTSMRSFSSPITTLMRNRIRMLTREDNQRIWHRCSRRGSRYLFELLPVNGSTLLSVFGYSSAVAATRNRIAAIIRNGVNLSNRK